ncbi:MAG TPA: hypothetical protein GX405_14245 [Rhizobiales bacterium]|nr:hypothetical protein [Hyphomicrobiales bacterium]
MTNFLLVYHGGTMPASEEEGRKLMAAWMGWFGALGDAVVDGGNPVGRSLTVHPGGEVINDGGPNSTAGYTVLRAADADAAAALAKGCPHLGVGGTIEIAPIIEMG